MKNINKLLIFMILIVLTINSAFALGITPSRKIITFNDDLKEEVVFRIINNELKELDVHIYARGELAEYVEIEKELVHIPADQRETSIRYKIDAPYSARKPGVNVIEIVVEETASDSSKDTVIIGKLAVVHQLYLKAPFIGMYASAVFTSNNPEDGNLQFTYTLFNDGTENIQGFTAELEVYDDELELIGKMNYEFGSLAPGQHMKEARAFNQMLPPGDYTAKTTISYEGKTILKETSFTSGGAYIEIEKIAAKDFRLGSINQLDFYLYNKFFREIKNVFAEVIVKDKNNKVHSIFKTVSADLPAFTGEEVIGYWDTKDISIGLYNMLVKVSYKGRTAEEEFEIKVLQDELIASKIGITGQVTAGKTKVQNPIIPILTLAFIILVIINILLVIYIRKKKKPPEPINSFIIFINTAALLFELFGIII